MAPKTPPKPTNSQPKTPPNPRTPKTPNNLPQINNSNQLKQQPQTSILTTTLNLILTLALISLIIIASYLVYLNIPGEPQELNFNLQPIQPKIVNQSLQVGAQFLPNMKFNHNLITYNLDPNCEQRKKQRILEAFNYITNKVPQITFQKTIEKPDIQVTCTENGKEASKENYFIAGEGGAKKIIQTKDYAIINDGEILLFAEPARAKKCEWANIETHELMHVFGFDHSSNPNDLMYPYLESCDQKLNPKIINKLIKLYSEKNLPDLYFDTINATKKGRYLDFNLTIKNSGTIKSSNVTLNILDDNKLAESRDLGPINYGAGISIEIQNLKLIHKNPDEIIFIIDQENNIQEMNEKNNKASIELE